MIENITLNQEGIPLAAHLYLPEGNDSRCPAVVTAPGFGGVKKSTVEWFQQTL